MVGMKLFFQGCQILLVLLVIKMVFSLQMLDETCDSFEDHFGDHISLIGFNNFTNLLQSVLLVHVG